MPIPLKLKYGRIGLIRIDLPSVWSLTTSSNFKIAVTISDVFLCLATKPMTEWNENSIIDEFHDSKQKTLDSYEEDAKFFYIEQKGDDEQMNKFVLSIIQNLQITIERVYVRIEDPFPFALGLLLPSITVKTANDQWQIVQSQTEKPEILYKLIRIEDFSLFMERDSTEVSIDEIIKLNELQNLDEKEMIEQREKRIYQHIRSIFLGIQQGKSGPQHEEEFKEDGRVPTEAVEIDADDFIIRKFDIDVRLQITIDKVRQLNKAKNDGKQLEPDMKIQIICGGLFDIQADDPNQHHMQIQIREDQINAITQFLSVTGLFNTFRLGVLKAYYETHFYPNNPDIIEYIRVYERYQQEKIDNHEEMIKEYALTLREIERSHRADVIFMLRKAINERFYGLKKAEEYRQQKLKQLEPPQPAQNGILSKLPFMGGKTQIQNLKLTDPEKHAKIRQINFATAFMKMFYNSRYKLHINEIILISKDKFDPSQAILPPQENSSMNLQFDLPKLSLQLFSSKVITQNQIAKPRMLLHLVIEGLTLGMYTESKPEYMLMKIALKNIYIKDNYSPMPALPYFIQTIIPSSNRNNCKICETLETGGTIQTQLNYNSNNFAVVNAIEVEYEVNPKVEEQQQFVGNQKLKLYSYGQLLIYLNLEFARRMIEFTSRVLATMNKNYQHMMENAPPEIKKELTKGSFYQEMLEKMIANKQEQLKNSVQSYTQGTMEAPKLHLDIFFISPKIIIHEGLLGSKIMDSEDVTALIIDLGHIEAKTFLVKKERHIDYTKVMDKKSLYDIVQVKFGKLKIVADYKLRLSNTLISDKVQGWGHSPLKVDITNEINFGFQIQTCLTAVHEIYPTQIINAKFEKLELLASRTVIQSILKIIALYQFGDFAKSLDDFLNQDQPVAPIQEERPRFKSNSEFDIVPDTSHRQTINEIDLDQINFSRKITGPPIPEEKPEEIKVDLHPQIKIEINFIFEKLEIWIQEVKVPHLEEKYKHFKIKKEYKKQPANKIDQLFIHDPRSLRSNSLRTPPKQNSAQNRPSPPKPKVLEIQSFLQFGISGLKGKLDLVPSEEKTRCQIFLRNLFIANKESVGNYKYFLHNPLIEEDEEAKRPTNSVSKISHQYLGNNLLTYKVNLQNGGVNKTVFKRENIDVDFNVFKYFNPEQELLSMNNQIYVDYMQIKDDTVIKVILQSLRVCFLVPDLKRILNFYVNLTVDQEQVPNDVKSFYKYASKNDQHDIPISARFDTHQSKDHHPHGFQLMADTQRQAKHALHDKNQQVVKTFNLNKIYAEGDEERDEHKQKLQTKSNKQANLAKTFKSAQKTEKLEKEKADRLRKQVLMKKGFTKSKKFAKMKLAVEVVQLEVLAPTNVYEAQSIALKIATKCDFQMQSESVYIELHTKDNLKTLIESRLKYETSDMQIGINQLSIYTEFQDFTLNPHGAPSGERSYLLKPYNVMVEMSSKKNQNAVDDSDNKSILVVTGQKYFELQLGLREINTYLLIGQVYFSFMNDLTLIQSKIDRASKRIIEGVRKKILRRLEKGGNKSIDQSQIINEAGVTINNIEPVEDKPMSLDQILVSEGLLKIKVNKTRTLWQRSFAKLKTLLRVRNYFDSKIVIDLKGFQFAIVDNLVSTQYPLALLKLGIKDFRMNMKSRTYQDMTNEMMDKWFRLDKLNTGFFHLLTTFELCGSYYNKNTFADEPFIETFPLLLRITQDTPLSDTKQVIISEQLLNINFTYGLLCNVQVAIMNLLKIEKENPEEMVVKPASNINLSQQAVSQEEEIKSAQIYRKKQISNMLKNSAIVARQISPSRIVDEMQCSIGSIQENSIESSSFDDLDLSSVTDVQFLNKTGIPIKYCLSLMKEDLDAAWQKNTTDPRITDNIRTLDGQKNDFVSLHEFEMLMSQQQRTERSVIKIDFAVQGFTSIKGLILQKNGMFGYYLYPCTKKKRDYIMGQSTGLSLIVRVKRDQQFIQVYFESSLVLMNDTCHQIDFIVLENALPKQVQELITLQPGDVYNPPLTWLSNHASIYQRFPSIQEVNLLLFKDLAEVCDPRITNPYTDHSKVLKVNRDQFISADLYFLKTKTLVGQFLIAFHPLLQITNLLFTELYVQPKPELQRVIKSNNSLLIYEINPYDLGATKFQIQYKETEIHTYSNNEVTLNLKKLEANSTVGFQEGLFIDLKLEDQRDSDIQHNMYVVFEKQLEAQPLRNTEYSDFGLRAQIYSRRKCLSFQVYFPYLAVNKTPLKITLMSTFLERTVQPFSSVFIRPIAAKLQILVDNYHKSPYIDIFTYGISGSIMLKKKKKVHKSANPFDDQHWMMDPSLNRDHQNVLEIGTYIGLCPHPYSKTKVIKFLPRYIFINKLDLPIVVKERNSKHQIAIVPREEVYFNLGQDEDDKLMIRVLNVKLETRQNPRTKYQSSLPNGTIDLNNLISQGGLQSEPQPNIISDEIQISEENRNKPQMTSDLVIELSPTIAEDQKNWSYFFPLSKVDDFQITVPNQNPIANKDQGWQNTQENLFVRVNISPGPENDATLFVSFTKPYYPEYAFYNETPHNVVMYHQQKSPNNSQYNNVYKFAAKTRQPFVLNPNDKDEDFLIIEIMSGDTVQHRFKYEIDSLRLQFPANNPKFLVVTKMSGNFRFIQLQTEEQRLEERKARIDAGLQKEDELDEDHNESDEEDREIEKTFQEIGDEDFKGLAQQQDNTLETSSSLDSNLTSSSDSSDEEGSSPLNEQHDRERKYARLLSADHRLGDVSSGQEVQTLYQYISLKGLGISLVNSDPKEIIYLSLYDVQLLMYSRTMKQGFVERTKRKMDFRIMNFQVDNMTMRSFPVIIGPRKAFNYRERYHQQSQSIIGEQKEEAEVQTDFLQFYLDHSVSTEGKISSQMIKKLDFALQEININFHQHALNYVLQFIGSLGDLMSDELIQSFMKSEALFAYERLMEMMSMEDEEFMRAVIVETSIFKLHDATKDELQLMDQNRRQLRSQMDLERIEHYRKSLRKLQGIIGERAPVTDEMEEEQSAPAMTYEERTFLQRFEQDLIIGSGGLLIMQHQVQEIKTKEEVCPELSPDRLEFKSSEAYNENKILVQEISIKALRLYLTFRIQQLEGAIGVQGITQSLLNFLSNFTNVSDAAIYFTQIDITKAYTTMDSINMKLTKHYLNQGIQQIYKVLGATDIVGNPVGLISNLGRGVEELYSEPLQGALSGDMSRAARGIGKGVVGFAKKTTYGLSNSVSKLTGTWYMGIKGFSGRQISESNMDNPDDVPVALWEGTKGLGMEMVKGVTGVVMVPRQRVKESGVGCMQISKGTIQGLFGLVSAPFTGSLRFIHSFSTGLKNTTGNEKPLKRFRYPRYFDDRECMRAYDRVFSHAYTAIQTVENGKFKNEMIMFAFDYSGFVRGHFKDRVMVCTDRRLIAVQNFNQLKIHVKVSEIHSVDIGKPDVSKIIFTVHGSGGKKKQHEIQTDKPKQNARFIEELRKILLNLAQQNLRGVIPQPSQIMIKPALISSTSLYPNPSATRQHY